MEAVHTEIKKGVDHSITRILVPTDLTPIADRTLEFTLDLARRLGARVELLTVISHVEGDVFSPVRYSPEASAEHSTVRDLLRKDLEALLMRHDPGDVPVELSLQKGSPVPTVISRAKQFGADLLVVGTHERGRLRQFLIPSTAEEIVRRSPCSVLVIHERDCDEPVRVDRILVPVDLSGISESLIRYAASLAGAYDARLDVLHVVEPVPLLDAFSGAMTIRDMVPDMRKRSEAELHALLERVDLEDYDFEVTTLEGHAAARILDAAAKKESDLIVMGRQGRSAVERFFVGSVTERVVRHAGSPVLVADL